MTDSSPSVTPTNRKPFYLVLVLFAAPLALAFALYYGSSLRPLGTTNKGELISPAVPLPEITLPKADGSTTGKDFLRRTWTLVHLQDGSCDNVCRNALLVTRNARELLGKDMPRVSRVLLFKGSTDNAYLQTEHRDLVAANVDSNEAQVLLKQFPVIADQSALKSGRTYIVDPLGNLMMSYAPGTNPRDIYQDLKKLLNLSHIG